MDALRVCGIAASFLLVWMGIEFAGKSASPNGRRIDSGVAAASFIIAAVILEALATRAP